MGTRADEFEGMPPPLHDSEKVEARIMSPPLHESETIGQTENEGTNDGNEETNDGMSPPIHPNKVLEEEFEEKTKKDTLGKINRMIPPVEPLEIPQKIEVDDGRIPEENSELFMASPVDARPATPLIKSKKVEPEKKPNQPEKLSLDKEKKTQKTATKNKNIEQGEEFAEADTLRRENERQARLEAMKERREKRQEEKQERKNRLIKDDNLISPIANDDGWSTNSGNNKFRKSRQDENVKEKPSKQNWTMMFSLMLFGALFGIVFYFCVHKVMRNRTLSARKKV